MRMWSRAEVCAVTRCDNRAGLGVLITLLALLYAACSGGVVDDGGSAPPCTPDLASIQTNIFLRSCAQNGCHGATEPAAALNLAGADVAAQLVGVPSSLCDGRVRVVPGAPTQSLLYEKMASAAPACGARMPPLGGLTEAEIACVRDWIAAEPQADAGSDAGGCETCGGSACVSLAVDPANCGACGAACMPGATCAGGACACAGGLAACGSSCVDTALDSENCGQCGKSCPAGALCGGGQCACANSLSLCGGACVDAASDPANCGGCGAKCGAGEVCNMGKCAASCGALSKCGASCVDTGANVLHCGACDNACPAGATCTGGVCGCPPGTTACGGACINTTTDPANCGGCGIACSQGTTCEAGACVCPGGGTVCGVTCVDTQTSTSHCGACGNACAGGQTCVAGACSCGSSSVSFSGAVQPIFTASCGSNGCHKGAGAQGDLDLSAGASYQALVNVSAKQCNDGRKRVLPGQPSQSYLIDKIMGVDLCAGTQMPKMNLLPAAQIEAISNWICAGAPNN